LVDFGSTLARLRRSTGLTVASLARAMNVEQPLIERLERGDTRPPGRQMVLDLARAMALGEAQTDELLWSANHLPRRMQYAEPTEGHTVALFVDHENVYIALNELLKSLPPELQLQERRKIDPAVLALGLRTAAEQIGWVKVALSVADWERLPAGQVKEYLKLRFQIDYNLPGRNNADLKLSDAIRNVLEHDEYSDIDTYVLVTGDGGYLTVLDTLLRRQKQVHVWGVRGATNGVLQQNASAFAWVEDLLGMATSRPPAPRPEPEDNRPVENHNHVNHTVSTDHWRSLPRLSIGNDVSRLEAMAIHLSRHLRSRSWSYITFVRFLAFLAETGVFGATREEQLAWLSHAKETGVLREEIVDDPTDPSRIARRFYLNDAHPLVERAQGIRTRIGEIVPTAGRGLAFGVVIDRLINEPDLHLTDVQAKNWLTWFAEAGYLQAEQVPHFRKEGVTVTLLRQNPGYWEPAVTLDGDGDRGRLDNVAEFAAVRLANFLERHPHFGWMALSQLLNQMTEGLGAETSTTAAINRQRAKQAVALAQELSYLEVEQIPNLKTGGTTTVARLVREHPRVVESLALRDNLVRRLAEMLASRSCVPRALLQLSVVEKLGLSYEDAAAWIDLLVREGLFSADLDHEGTPGYLRLDQQDLIVSRVLFGAFQTVEGTERLSS
jgi:transcriptional regulator with XRE-family HTH domain